MASPEDKIKFLNKVVEQTTYEHLKKLLNDQKAIQKIHKKAIHQKTFHQKVNAFP
jgi:hypothetical protein